MIDHQTHRITLEIDRNGTAPHRLTFRHNEPEPLTNEDGWILINREDIIGPTPIGMPDTGLIRINPLHVAWTASVPVGLQGAVA